MPAIAFKIITPERLVFASEVDQATLPALDGEVTILPNHIPYIAPLKSGEIILKRGEEEISLAVSGGFIEFSANTLSVLADTAERAEEIDVARAEAAKKRAEELKMRRASIDEQEFAKVAAVLERELARIKVAKKYQVRKHR